ncbi:MAG: hypothetical protein H0U23_08410 [Blastocatellia bacterium]|nr:hypothetical protein [Blastocatellia bacterium]
MAKNTKKTGDEDNSGLTRVFAYAAKPLESEQFGSAETFVWPPAVQIIDTETHVKAEILGQDGEYQSLKNASPEYIKGSALGLEAWMYGRYRNRITETFNAKYDAFQTRVEELFPQYKVLLAAERAATNKFIELRRAHARAEHPPVARLQNDLTKSRSGRREAKDSSKIDDLALSLAAAKAESDAARDALHDFIVGLVKNKETCTELRDLEYSLEKNRATEEKIVRASFAQKLIKSFALAAELTSRKSNVEQYLDGVKKHGFSFVNGQEPVGLYTPDPQALGFGTYQAADDSLKAAVKKLVRDPQGTGRMAKWTYGQILTGKRLQFKKFIDPQADKGGADPVVCVNYQNDYVKPSKHLFEGEGAVRLFVPNPEFPKHVIVAFSVGQGKTQAWTYFHMKQHRPLPDGLVKRARIVFNTVGTKTLYEIQFTVTLKDDRKPSKPRNGSDAVIQLEYTPTEKGLHVGTIVVGQDRQNIYLPDSLWKDRPARSESIRDYMKEEVETFRQGITDWQMDNPDAEIPAKLARLIGNIVLTRRDKALVSQEKSTKTPAPRAIARLCDTWRKNRFEGDDEIFSKTFLTSKKEERYRGVDGWLRRYSHLYDYERFNSLRVKKSRVDLYRTIASQLATDYGNIVVASPDLKTKARKTKKSGDGAADAIRELGRKKDDVFRKAAALYEFKNALKQAALKHLRGYEEIERVDGEDDAGTARAA